LSYSRDSKTILDTHQGFDDPRDVTAFSTPRRLIPISLLRGARIVPKDGLSMMCPRLLIMNHALIWQVLFIHMRRYRRASGRKVTNMTKIFAFVFKVCYLIYRNVRRHTFSVVPSPPLVEGPEPMIRTRRNNK
jgi:hypothetical protein